KGSGTGYETALVKVDKSGHVWVYSGTPAQGQSHETTFSQVTAECIGVAENDVYVVATDTAGLSVGNGTNASRSGPVGVPAIAKASRLLRQKILRWASVILDVPEEELRMEDGLV